MTTHGKFTAPNSILSTGDPRRETKRRPVPRLIHFALIASFLPIGIGVGLPFELSPADVLLPLCLPYALTTRPLPRVGVLLGWISLWSLLIVLGWGLFTDTSVLAQIGTWAFFYKSWIALILAYAVVRRSSDPRDSFNWIIKALGTVQVITMLMLLAGWGVTGHLVTGSLTDNGLNVTGFTAGIWEYPVRIYGFGQVNATANLMTLAGPIMAYLAAESKLPIVRLFWLAWIPISWWLILNSGSRGALITAGLFVAALPLAPGAKIGSISVPKLLLALVIGVGVISQAPMIVDTSPKYAKTLQEFNSGNASETASGRTQLNELTIDDVKRSPLVGTAFGDYQRFHSSQNSEWVNSSPHNTYAGPFLKGGIPVGVAYLILLLRILPWRRVRRVPGSGYLALPICIMLIVGVFPVGDALTTPVLAASILGLCGALLALAQRFRAT